MYKFKSKASGDVIMLAAHGDLFLRTIGREPAPKGIIEPADMPAVLATLRAAIAAAGQPAPGADDADETPVGLAQRFFPMIQLLEASAAERVPVVWGV